MPGMVAYAYNTSTHDMKADVELKSNLSHTVNPCIKRQGLNI